MSLVIGKRIDETTIKLYSDGRTSNRSLDIIVDENSKKIVKYETEKGNIVLIGTSGTCHLTGFFRCAFIEAFTENEERFQLCNDDEEIRYFLNKYVLPKVIKQYVESVYNGEFSYFRESSDTLGFILVINNKLFGGTLYTDKSIDITPCEDFAVVGSNDVAAEMLNDAGVEVEKIFEIMSKKCMSINNNIFEVDNKK